MDEIIRFMFTSSDGGNTFFSRRGQQKLKVNIGVEKGTLVAVYELKGAPRVCKNIDQPVSSI